MSNTPELTMKQKIEAAQLQLAATIKELKKHGLTPEEKAQIADAKRAFNAFKKSLKDKKTAKTAAPSAPSAAAPAAAAGGTGPSELKLPGLFPKVSVTNGSIKYEHAFDADLHKKISKQKTFPICTGLKLGGVISVESKASLKLAIQGAYKTEPAQLPKNEWSSYQVTSSLGADISSTGAFQLVLTDSLELLAAKFGVVVQCVFNNKQIEVTNLFSGGKMTVEALALSCSLAGSIGPGETLNEIYELINGKACPNFAEWNGTKYTLLQVGVSIQATDKGILPAAPTIGLNQAGVDALKADISAIYDQAKELFEEIKPTVIKVAFATLPAAGVAFYSYELLGDLYNYITADKHGFEQNKQIYVQACESIVKEIMEREASDPNKLKELAKIAKNEKQLKARYQLHMKEAQNVQIIKDIYDNLNKNTEEGLQDAKDNLNQILTKVELTYNQISEVKENNGKYSVHFKVLVTTNGPVVIPSVKASISCNGTVLSSSVQDSNDTYDNATKKVYDGYWVDFSKADLQAALGGKSIAQSTWMLTLHADYRGHFKDVNSSFNISKDLKVFFSKPGNQPF
ncbi:MAG: Unknown protein [uncultured Aureispira sp.]|uniref:Uncharacterized protein n=1 Tax=uncultured Aureispira sp. TaxID=1331704 RepID=A0A6S6TPZ4_9BACT|nr:MAG: Unknown protein [uncultured Aureispira sp.]